MAKRHRTLDVHHSDYPLDQLPLISRTVHFHFRHACKLLTAILSCSVLLVLIAFQRLWFQHQITLPAKPTSAFSSAVINNGNNQQLLRLVYNPYVLLTAIDATPGQTAPTIFQFVHKPTLHQLKTSTLMVEYGVVSVELRLNFSRLEDAGYSVSHNDGCMFRKPFFSDGTWHAMVRQTDSCSAVMVGNLGQKAVYLLAVNLVKQNAAGEFQGSQPVKPLRLLCRVEVTRKLQPVLPVSQQKRPQMCVFEQDCQVKMDNSSTKRCGLERFDLPEQASTGLSSDISFHTSKTCTGKLPHARGSGRWLVACDGGCLHSEKCDWKLAQWTSVDSDSRRPCRIPSADEQHIKRCRAHTSFAFVGDSTLRYMLWGLVALAEGHTKTNTEPEKVVYDFEQDTYYRMHYFNSNFTCPWRFRWKGPAKNSRAYCSFDGALVSGLEWLSAQQLQNKSKNVVLIVGGAAWFNTELMTLLNYTVRAYNMTNLKILFRGHVASWFVTDQWFATDQALSYTYEQILAKQHENYQLLEYAEKKLGYTAVDMWSLTVSRWKEFYSTPRCNCHHYTEPRLKNPSGYNFARSWLEGNGLLPAMVDVLAYGICQALT